MERWAHKSACSGDSEAATRGRVQPGTHRRAVVDTLDPRLQATQPCDLHLRGRRAAAAMLVSAGVRSAGALTQPELHRHLAEMKAAAARFPLQDAYRLFPGRNNPEAQRGLGPLLQ